MKGRARCLFTMSLLASLTFLAELFFQEAQAHLRGVVDADVDMDCTDPVQGLHL